MIERKKKICLGCGEEEYIWARKCCKKCASKDKPTKELKRTAIKQTFKKPTGELAIFQAIWATRPHKCQVTGEPILEFHPKNFSHILSKGAYPKFRLYEKNIIIKSEEAHHQWEFTPRSDLKKDPQWYWIFDLQQTLKEEYARGNQNDNSL